MDNANIENDKQGVFVAIYARVSSEKQEKDGNIDSQIQALEKAVAENGDTIVRRYMDDGYSGELLERPDLDEMRNDASKGIFKKVYFLSPDRLARKSFYAAIVLEDLEKNGVRPVFINRPLGDSPEDKLLFGVQSLFSDYEKAKIADRMRRGKLYKINKGNVLGNVAPYGYRYVKNAETKNGKYKIVEEEAEIVRFIFSYYTSGECSGLGGIRKELFRKGIKSRDNSTKWAQSTVARIVSNETYIGTTFWGKSKSIEGKNGSNGYKRLKNNARIKKPREEWLPISVPSIITPELFAKTVEMRARNKSVSVNNVTHGYLVRGISRCLCGFPMYSKMCHGTAYYVCSKQRQDVPGQGVKCENSRHFRGQAIDDAVWEEFCKIALSPEMLMHRIKQKRSNRTGELANAQEQINFLDKKVETLQSKRERFIKLYADEVITLDEFKAQTAELQRQLETLNAKKLVLQRTVLEEPGSLPEETILKEFSERMQRVIANADFQTKQKVIRFFLSQILIQQNEATAKGFLPADLLNCVPTSTESKQRGHGYTAVTGDCVPMTTLSQSSGSLIGRSMKQRSA